jgi:hypothetical protein
MARLLAFVLRTYMNQDGECWPSVATLARNMRVSRDTVGRARKELTEAGLLDVIAHQGHANHYRARYRTDAAGVPHPCEGGYRTHAAQNPSENPPPNPSLDEPTESEGVETCPCEVPLVLYDDGICVLCGKVAHATEREAA